MERMKINDNASIPTIHGSLITMDYTINPYHVMLPHMRIDEQEMDQNKDQSNTFPSGFNPLIIMYDFEHISEFI